MSTPYVVGDGEQQRAEHRVYTQDAKRSPNLLRGIYPAVLTEYASNIRGTKMHSLRIGSDKAAWESPLLCIKTLRKTEN